MVAEGWQREPGAEPEPAETPAADAAPAPKPKSAKPTKGSR
jgi:hypothetical protein